MLYLVAILLPPLAVLIAGKPVQALLNVVLTLLLYVPGLIHALLVVGNYYADKRSGRIERAIREASGSSPAFTASAAPAAASSVPGFATPPMGASMARAGGFGSVPVFPKPDIGARAIAQVPSGTELAVHETRGIFARVSLSTGASGWVRSADIQR